MNQLLLRRRASSFKKRTLPYDAEIEYLESTGTQYIDTGIPLNGYVRVVTDAQMLQVNTSATLFGVMLSTGRYGCRFYNGSEKLYLYYGGSGDYNNQRCTNYQGDGFYLNRRIYDYANVVTIGGRRHYRAAGENLVSFNSQSTIYSYGFNALDALGVVVYAQCKARKWSEKIYVNDILVWDAIPVRVGTVGYMYDKVSGQLFGNSGTDNFVLGNDKN